MDNFTISIFGNKLFFEIINELKLCSEFKIKCYEDLSLCEKDAEKETLKFIKKYGENGQLLLCGNSVHQDRNFLFHHMRKLHDYFHYRNLDITSIKELYRSWYPSKPSFEKKNLHTAYEDIVETIEELKFYKDHIFSSIELE